MTLAPKAQTKAEVVSSVKRRIRGIRGGKPDITEASLRFELVTREGWPHGAVDAALEGDT